jgi:uncharacterized membrane protein YdjX (TVP38/TMEM64 family)
VPTPKSKSLLKLALLVLFIGGTFYVLRYTPLGQYLSVQSVRAWIESFPPALVPLIYIGVYILGTVLVIPGTVLSFVGAILFGAYLGTLYTWIGATLGATLAFLLAKSLGRDFVDQLLAGRFEDFERRLAQKGFTSLLILRLLPWFPFTGINFGAGLTRIGLRDYVLATAIGILPGTFIYQLLFAKLGEKALTNEWQWSDLADWELGVAIVLFVGFVWLGAWVARRMQREGREPSETAPP